MASENLFMKNAMEKGLIDQQEIAVAADIKCTNGNQGRAWGFLNGSMLHLYELAGLSELGTHVETIDLKNAQFVKASSFVLNTTLQLKYNNETYFFRGFAQAKKVIEAIKEACGA